MFRSSSLRLAALYTALFSLAVIILGAVTLFATREGLARQFDARIQSEATALAQEYVSEGLEGLRQAVIERDRTPGALDYGLQGPAGAPMAGRLSGARSRPGWSTLMLAEADGDHEGVRVLTTDLPQGYRLMVGDDAERIEALDGVVLRSFSLTLLGVVLLGVLGGFLLSRGVHRRLAAITGTAEAIIDGDLARRVPALGASDDLDRLAATFNRMLDRISALMETLKQVSTDIAHDLRTPLTRLRQRLEAGLENATPAEAETLEAAMADLDDILGTFAALLRIAQIEGGARRAAFQQTDLAAIARTVVEAFAPSAEDAGQTLTLDAPEPVLVQGDRELLTQMLVNLVENALRHAGPTARIQVRAAQLEGAAILCVTDDGPGVPIAERDRLFDRFYRLEASRSTPGSGLGLALVSAVARLHRAEPTLAEAGPGLAATVRFPET
ncbi:MAG: sensor histidine kinase [Caulobacter sp.]|nr:sensor histidine kinase [Caulobacter sp.]